MFYEAQYLYIVPDGTTDEQWDMIVRRALAEIAPDVELPRDLDVRGHPVEIGIKEVWQLLHPQLVKMGFQAVAIVAEKSFEDAWGYEEPSEEDDAHRFSKRYDEKQKADIEPYNPALWKRIIEWNSKPREER